jgi:hypothetical protein
LGNPSARRGSRGGLHLGGCSSRACLEARRAARSALRSRLVARNSQPSDCGPALAGPQYAYPGDRPDVTQFPAMLDQLFAQCQAVCAAAGADASAADMTVVFDAGQNSAGNFAHLAGTGLHYVGSVPASDCPDLTALAAGTRTAVDKDRFGGLTAFDTRRTVYGADRRAILTHSPELHAAQAAGFDGTTLAKAGKKLSELAATLASGRARRPREKVEAEIEAITHWPVDSPPHDHRAHRRPARPLQDTRTSQMGTPKLGHTPKRAPAARLTSRNSQPASRSSETPASIRSQQGWTGPPGCRQASASQSAASRQILQRCLRQVLLVHTVTSEAVEAGSGWRGEHQQAISPGIMSPGARVRL